MFPGVPEARNASRKSADNRNTCRIIGIYYTACVRAGFTEYVLTPMANGE